MGRMLVILFSVGLIATLIYHADGDLMGDGLVIMRAIEVR